MTKNRLVLSLSRLGMKPTRMLVILRKPNDLESAALYLKEQATRPYLVIAFLNFKIPASIAAQFETTQITREMCSKALASFEFEIAPLDYEGTQLPASVFAKACLAFNCDSAIVVSDGRKQLHASDLSSTLAVESPVPLVVIKP